MDETSARAAGSDPVILEAFRTLPPGRLALFLAYDLFKARWRGDEFEDATFRRPFRVACEEMTDRVFKAANIDADPAIPHWERGERPTITT